MKIEAFILCYLEADIIGYCVRHYASFCDRVKVIDLGSNDGSQETAKREGAEIIQDDCAGIFDDRKNQNLKNTCWHGTDADWVIVADADELIFFPHGSFSTLAAYDAQDLPIIKTHGFEMFSDAYPTTDRQIYDEVKEGAPDDQWYGKKCLFSPKRVKSISFTMGAHSVWEAFLHNGQRVTDPARFPEPPCWLLHFHHLGGLDRVARRYDENYKRQCENNHRHKFGNQQKGIIHANEKRSMILSKLRRVIP